MREAIPPYSQ